MTLRSITDIDSAYFEILLQLKANERIKLSELVGRAQVRNSASSNSFLADFLRKYDEMMVSHSESELDAGPLGIDEDYKQWLGEWLGSPGPRNKNRDRSRIDDLEA